MALNVVDSAVQLAKPAPVHAPPVYTPPYPQNPAQAALWLAGMSSSQPNGAAPPTPGHMTNHEVAANFANWSGVMPFTAVGPALGGMMPGFHGGSPSMFAMVPNNHPGLVSAAGNPTRPTQPLPTFLVDPGSLSLLTPATVQARKPSNAEGNASSKAKPIKAELKGPADVPSPTQSTSDSDESSANGSKETRPEGKRRRSINRAMKDDHMLAERRRRHETGVLLDRLRSYLPPDKLYMKLSKGQLLNQGTSRRALVLGLLDDLQQSRASLAVERDYLQHEVALLRSELRRIMLHQFQPINP